MIASAFVEHLVSTATTAAATLRPLDGDVSGGHVVVAEVLAQPPAQAPSLGQVLTNARNWVMGIAGGLATFFLTLGGILYLTAGGDLSNVERAKAALRNAAIGYAITVLAPVLFAIVSQIVGA